MVIQLGILFASDTEEAEVDQPDSAGGYPAAVEAAAAQVMQSGGPQGRQRAGEVEHVLELLGIALLPPEPVEPPMPLPAPRNSLPLTPSALAAGSGAVMSGQDVTTPTSPMPRACTGALIWDASPTRIVTRRFSGNAAMTAAVASAVPVSARRAYN